MCHRYFRDILHFNCHSSSLSQELRVAFNLPKVTQQVSNRLGFEAGTIWFQSLCFFLLFIIVGSSDLSRTLELHTGQEQVKQQLTCLLPPGLWALKQEMWGSVSRGPVTWCNQVNSDLILQPHSAHTHDSFTTVLGNCDLCFVFPTTLWAPQRQELFLLISAPSASHSRCPKPYLLINPNWV